jgi:excisionase family DNA binding protein
MSTIETMTPREAAAVLKCSYDKVLCLIREGRLAAASGIGRSYIITRAAIEKLLDEAHNQQRQASQAERSRKQCQSASEKMGSGTATLPRRTEGHALDVRLAQLTSGKRRNCTTR